MKLLSYLFGLFQGETVEPVKINRYREAALERWRKTRNNRNKYRKAALKRWTKKRDEMALERKLTERKRARHAKIAAAVAPVGKRRNPKVSAWFQSLTPEQKAQRIAHLVARKRLKKLIREASVVEKLSFPAETPLAVGVTA